MAELKMETLVSLCKRRGIIFPGSDLYSGLGGTFDYGPIGVELKNNVKKAWWRSVVYERNDIEGLDAAILMHPRTWVASGHVEGFTDPLVDCKVCKKRFRADHVEEKDFFAFKIFIQGEGDTWDETGQIIYAESKKAAKALLQTCSASLPSGKNVRVEQAEGQPFHGKRCPECGGELTEPRNFNLMFKTFVGPVEEDAATVYLRPETAQGIFVNFPAIMDTMRRKLPFGIAQIGKSFRNEITPRNFIFRTREFEQMEIEFFCKPGTDVEWYEYWVNERYNWYRRFGIRAENLRLRPHEKTELAHYARACKDVEYKFPIGWSELEGIANRGNFDLTQHQTFSGKDLTYFDEESRERYIPYVIEPSGGVDRTTLAFLADAYREETVRDRQRVVLALHPFLAPVKAAVFPLLANRPEIVETARKIAMDLKKEFYTVYDDTAAIGKLYRRQDEIGTPFCITVDVETLADQAVTIRDRDSMEQERIAIDKVAVRLHEKFKI
ncbi:MAG TPA: glycine--tRNA ligase [Candidatus Sumerlaeota bacterium]|nr:MAG: Glycine--tRNA ligase [candidate division BRC1 bacterium ADurb.Bin183]HOE63076.1 glycine--tRNA ligase [Candidatus Sumerlaeota bacterium]HRR30150.1 glycine--tRNA ligase [Candidatus Sumerlaeia bacterium]HON51458.1 glycine--tRNA ligase [Candidatus Sumerlaeota bacterium]HOR65335.1 glycine--tRNA ligase [Candidatus Sumerlaeota bacterium]